MKRIALGSVVVLLFSVSASAAPSDCLSITTLQQLLAMTSEGCQHQDKIFSNFAYNLTDSVDVKATHFFSNLPALDIHGWNFTHENGTWTTGFTLAYTISIAPGFPNITIFQAKDQQNSGSIPNGTSVTDTQVVLIPGSPAQTRILTTNGGATANETTQLAFSPDARSIRTTSVFTPGGGQLLSWEQSWFEHAIPEPGTWLLSGGALVLIGLWGRRRRRSA